MPGFASNFCTVGEASTVKIKTDTTPKLEDHSVHCLFVGYSLTHPTGCYRMYDLKSQRVYIMHDVVWLHQMIYWKTNSVGSYIWTTGVLEIGHEKHKGCHNSLKWGREFLKGMMKNHKKFTAL